MKEIKKHKIMPGAVCWECCEEMKLVDNSVIVRFHIMGRKKITSMSFTIEGEKYICPKCKKQVIINFQYLPSIRKFGFHDMGLGIVRDENE